MDTSFHVRHAIGGDRTSVEWLIEHFSPFIEAQAQLRVGPTLTTDDREELVAAVWSIVLARLRDLREREGRFAPVLVKFLGTTTLNLCNAYLRDRIRRGASPEVDLDQLACETRGIVTRCADRDLVVTIRRSLEAMAKDKRDVLVLRLLEQRSNQEIAACLGVPANTVAVRYRRALSELRERLPRRVFTEIWRSRAGA